MRTEILLGERDPQDVKLMADDGPLFFITQLYCLTGNLIGVYTAVDQALREVGEFILLGQSHVEVIILTAWVVISISIFLQNFSPGHYRSVTQGTSKQKLNVDVLR